MIDTLEAPIVLSQDSGTTSVIAIVGPESMVATTGDSLSNDRAQRQLLIVKNPNICQGEPTIRGTRISVAHIVELHHLLGWNIRKIKEEYPYLDDDQIRAALEYYEERHREIDTYLQQEKENEEE